MNADSLPRAALPFSPSSAARHVLPADPTDFPHSFRPRAQALPFLRDRTSFYFHSFSSSLHSFSLLLSWFPFLSSKLGLRWAQMVVQGPCTTTKKSCFEICGPIPQLIEPQKVCVSIANKMHRVFSFTCPT